MADIVLATARLWLRRIGEDDAAEHNRVLNTPAVMRHLGGVMSLEDIARRHAKGRAMFAREGFGFLFMIEQASGEMVGYCGVKRVDNPHAPNLGSHEIGWIVREDRWRRGYAYEAMLAVIDWAFGAICAPHLVALTSAANTGSWKLMEKLGMERCCDLDFIDPAFPPEDSPTIQYRLTPERWAATKEAAL
ncbi:MAG: GNAT family N-acetyltransferase [Erythrobacter sp.]